MKLLPVFQQIVVLFLLMGVGYAANCLHIMNKDSERLFSRVIVNLTCPALILHSVTICGRLESGWMLLQIFGAAVGYFLLLPIAARLLARLLHAPAAHFNEYESMLIYSNLGFVGIPVIRAVQCWVRMRSCMSLSLSRCLTFRFFLMARFCCSQQNGKQGNCRFGK